MSGRKKSVSVLAAATVMVVLSFYLLFRGHSGHDAGHDADPAVVADGADRARAVVPPPGSRPPLALSKAELAARLPRVSAPVAAAEAAADRAAPAAAPRPPSPAVLHDEYLRLRNSWNALRTTAASDRGGDPSARAAQVARWRQENRAALATLEAEFGATFPEGDPALLAPRHRPPGAPFASGLPASSTAPGAARPDITTFLQRREQIAAERAALVASAAPLPEAERAAILGRWEAENAARLRQHRGRAAELNLQNFEQTPPR